MIGLAASSKATAVGLTIELMVTDIDQLYDAFKFRLQDRIEPPLCIVARQTAQ